MESDPQGLKEKSKTFLFSNIETKRASLKLYNGIVLDIDQESVFWKVLPLLAFYFSILMGQMMWLKYYFCNFGPILKQRPFNSC